MLQVLPRMLIIWVFIMGLDGEQNDSYRSRKTASCHTYLPLKQEFLMFSKHLYQNKLIIIEKRCVNCFLKSACSYFFQAYIPRSMTKYICTHTPTLLSILNDLTSWEVWRHRFNKNPSRVKKAGILTVTNQARLA